MNYINPENLFPAVLTQMDEVAGSKHSSIKKAALLFPLSGAALITNIATAASESLHLLGQLSLAGVKYGAIGSIRLFTRSNACESLYRKLPDGKSIHKTVIKIGKLVLGIFYSLLGLVDPAFNLRHQAVLGHFVKKRSVETKPAVAIQEPQQPEKNEKIDPPLELEKKKPLPKGCLKKPGLKKIRKTAPLSRDQLANIQMAKFLRAFQIVEHANTSLPEKKVHFAPDAALVQVRPIPTRKMLSKVDEVELFTEQAKKSHTSGSSVAPSLGVLTGVGAATLCTSYATSNNPTPFIQTYITGDTIRDVVAPTLVSSTPTLLSNATSGATAFVVRDVVAPTLNATSGATALVVRDVVAPSLVSSTPALLSNATNHATALVIRDVVAPTLVSSIPTLLSNATSSATTLAAPALSLAQLLPANLPVAVTNETCRLVASAVNALAAPALTVAQIANGNAPIVATEMAKQVSMSWSTLALVVAGLAVRVLPVFAGAVYG